MAWKSGQSYSTDLRFHSLPSLPYHSGTLRRQE